MKKIKISKHPVTGETLHGFIFADTEDNRYEAVTTDPNADPEKVLESAEFVHSTRRGIIDAEDIEGAVFKYRAYATPAAANEFIARLVVTA